VFEHSEGRVEVLQYPDHSIMAFYGFFGPLKGPQRVERPGNIKHTALTKVVYIYEYMHVCL
jgi:hypothetical protein